MSYNISHATEAVAQFLRSYGMLDDDSIACADDALAFVWNIDNSQVRMQIIQDAALQTGLLYAVDID